LPRSGLGAAGSAVHALRAGKARIHAAANKQRTATIVDLAGAAAGPQGGAVASPAAGTTVIVEVPREEGTSLSVRGGVAADATASAWRARVTVAPGASQQVRLDVDRPLVQSVQLLDAPAVLAGLLGQDLDGLAPATLAALRQIAELQAQRVAAQQYIADRQHDRIEAIADQQRERQNVQILAGNDPERHRYIESLGKVETRIEDLAARIERVRQDEGDIEDRLETALAALSVE
jgi:hypothetical protein